MSPGYPKKLYKSKQSCEIKASCGKLLVESFSTEFGHDILKINGNEYSGNAEVADIIQNAEGGRRIDGEVTWSSDESVTKKGWKLCLLDPEKTSGRSEKSKGGKR